MKGFWTLFVFMGIKVFLFAQNLVPNPGFEEFTVCPQTYFTRKADFIVPGWTSPTMGTPDLFHGCSTEDADVPFNWAGASNGHSGKGYAGIYVWSTSGENYREYLQSELAEQLKPGEKYFLEFYYKLASHAVYAANHLGMALTNSPINLQGDKLIQIAPALSVELDTTFISTTGEWSRARIEYMAKGGERYITVGSFLDDSDTKAIRLPFRIGKNNMLKYSSYYYIDDVSVRLIDSLKLNTVPGKEKFRKDTLELNQDYVLRNIQFEFDSYTLMRSSFVELDKVVEYLKENRDISVRLSGHTDFKGTDEYNVTLSRNRARSVADYLISKEIKSSRIVNYGFGKMRPITLGKSEDAQKTNRRVEIRFITEFE